MNLTEIITAIPVNGYVIVACLIVGYLMKKFIPADNKFIPTVLTVPGAVVACIMEGISTEIIIGGALSGLLSTGLHQLFKQYIEKTDFEYEEKGAQYVEDGKFQDNVKVEAGGEDDE